MKINILGEKYKIVIKSDKEASWCVDCGWARNEEMIDWFAIQGEKIYNAWQEAKCL